MNLSYLFSIIKISFIFIIINKVKEPNVVILKGIFMAKVLFRTQGTNH